MSDKALTDAVIKKKEEVLAIFQNFFLAFKGKFKDSSYILIVRLLTKTYAKLTIYPLNKDRILKIIFIGFDIKNIKIEETIKELRNFKIIHASGLTTLGNKSYYECYLDLSLGDEDYKDLKRNLDKIKNIFEDIKIVEIYLEK
ncbi:MAG: hypothetical protein EU531_06365 [Promethearchaeota archaeon]|nr:MAG: hypothetical protein EU531_06365 [Candidatus Lokiarchaeota archaeon]